MFWDLLRWVWPVVTCLFRALLIITAFISEISYGYNPIFVYFFRADIKLIFDINVTSVKPYQKDIDNCIALYSWWSDNTTGVELRQIVQLHHFLCNGFVRYFEIVWGILGCRSLQWETSFSVWNLCWHQFRPTAFIHTILPLHRKCVFNQSNYSLVSRVYIYFFFFS